MRTVNVCSKTAIRHDYGLQYLLLLDSYELCVLRQRRVTNLSKVFFGWSAFMQRLRPVVVCLDAKLLAGEFLMYVQESDSIHH